MLLINLTEEVVIQHACEGEEWTNHDTASSRKCTLMYMKCPQVPAVGG